MKIEQSFSSNEKCGVMPFVSENSNTTVILMTGTLKVTLQYS